MTFTAVIQHAQAAKTALQEDENLTEGLIQLAAAVEQLAIELRRIDKRVHSDLADIKRRITAIT